MNDAERTDGGGGRRPSQLSGWLRAGITGERIFAVATLGLAGLYLYGTFQLRSLSVSDPLGPKPFPLLIGGSAIALAICLWMGRRSSPSAAGATRAKAVGAMFAWIGAYVVAFEPIGYLLATAVFLFVLLAFFNVGHFVANLAIAVGFAAAVHFVFRQLLGVPLPEGILDDIVQNGPTVQVALSAANPLAGIGGT